MTTKRAPIFFTRERLMKLYESLVGRDKTHYKTIRAKVKAVYDQENRKTSFNMAWVKALQILRERKGYRIPTDARFETSRERENREQMRNDYFMQKKQDVDKYGEERAAVNAWWRKK